MGSKCQHCYKDDDEMRSPDGQRPLGLLLIHLTAEVPEAAAQAKVGDLGGLVVVNEDVPSREVTMDDLENW